MFLKNGRQFNLLFKTSNKFFKNKVNLTSNNITIQKNPIYLKLIVQSWGDLNINKKTFIFGK